MAGVHGAAIGQTFLSRAVLQDTGALLAIAKRRDANHQDATNCLAEIARKKLPLFITQPTIFETHRRILFDVGPAKGLEFLRTIYSSGANIVPVTPTEVAAAIDLIERYKALALTLTDAVNMAVMSSKGIAAAFTFDHHFSQAGFIRVPPLHI